MAKIVLREKIYIPMDEDDLEEAKEVLDSNFIIDMFDEKGCEPCPERDDRPNDVCTDCANYLARKKLYNTRTVNDQLYVGLPYGKKRLVAKIFPEVKKMGVNDMRPDIPFETALKFTGTPRPHQQAAIDELVELADESNLRGILVAPARSGKTPSSIALACTLRQRTLILANTHDLCMQFYATCVGSDNQDALTNAPALEKKLKRRVVVLADKLPDFFEGDIVISTYQKFITEIGKERLKEITSLFSLLLIDECHRANSNGFMKTVATLNTIHKVGLTATVTRKDGMDVLNRYILGPVLHKIKIETLIPEIVFHETGLFPKKDYSSWVYYCRWLERNSDRTAMILDWVMRDLKAKRFIIIPCVFTSQIHDLVRRINYMYGRNVAAAVVGGSSKKDKLKRDQILEDARSGKIKVVVGTRSIVGTGVNVPLWDTLYLINWLSNPPNFVQEYSRILTPLEEKKPLIRMFLDGSKQTRGCLRTCLFQTEGDTPTLAKQAIIKPEQWAIANKYLKSGKMDGKVEIDGAQKKTAKGRLTL